MAYNSPYLIEYSYHKMTKNHTSLNYLLAAWINPIQISGIYFLPDIIQTAVIPVRNNSITMALEHSQVIHHFATEERRAVLQCRFVNNNRCALCLDALHNTLNGALAEVIRIVLHCQPIDADGHVLFPADIPGTVGLIVACKMHSTRSAIKSFRVRLLSTMASIRFSGTSA